MSSVCGPSLFGGGGSNYIKVDGGSFVAIEGASIVEKLLLSDLRMPYKQLLKGRIILKKGQSDYLLNHLGLGDNATFLAIKATYDPKSVIEEDNYIQWSFYDDVERVNTLAQLLVLTGNSTNRIPQLWLTNPNDKYTVTLDVMVAVIDDETFFDYRPIVYFTLPVTLENAVYDGPYNTSLGNNFSITIESINDFDGYDIDELRGVIVDHVVESNGLLLSTTSSNYLLYDFDDNSINSFTLSGTYSMKFDITDSLNNSVSDEDNVVITYVTEYTPVVYFTPDVYLPGSTVSPVNTLMGVTFGATLSLTMSLYGGTVSNLDIATELVDYVLQADGITFSTSSSNFILYNYSDIVITGITDSGTYSLKFDITDPYGTLDPDKIVQFSFTAIP
jgi:hypothetical protein